MFFFGAERGIPILVTDDIGLIHVLLLVLFYFTMLCVLDPLGHHALTCKRGGDVVSCNNKLRDTRAEACRRAHLSVKVEAGSNLTLDHSHSNWSAGKPATFDLSVTSPLNLNILFVGGGTHS